MPTIAEALHIQDRTVSGRDAEVLLAAILTCDRTFLHTHSERSLSKQEYDAYQTSLSRREKNEPVAYITGLKEFYGRPFTTDARALIPRPETEGLVDCTLAWVKNLKQPRILEIGTGAGNIAITLAKELPIKNEAIITATDISTEALELAQENAQKLEASPITWLQADLFDHPTIKKEAPYDVIVANLPYVSTTWQHNPAAQPDVMFYEPDLALFGGNDGLDHYRAFFAAAPAFLKPSGHIVVEFGENEATQTGLLKEIIHQAFPHRTIKVRPDYAGLDRIIEI